MSTNENKAPANDPYVLDPNGDDSGTGLFAEVVLSPADVVRRFGNGHDGDRYKVSRRWVFRKGDLVFTLYDWKSTSLYDPDLWSPADLWSSSVPWDLNIGSKAPATAADVEEFVAYLRRTTLDSALPSDKLGADETAAQAHTPGPWYVRAVESSTVNWIIELEDGSVLASVGEGVNEGAPEQAESNARLIAAAPDLLEACEIQLENWRMLKSGEWHGSNKGIQAAIDHLERVITQAHGNAA